MNEGKRGAHCLSFIAYHQHHCILCSFPCSLPRPKDIECLSLVHGITVIIVGVYGHACRHHQVSFAGS